MGGGGQQQQGGGDIMSAISRMMQPQQQGITNYQQVFAGGGPPGPIGGIDIPPADMHDPFGGPKWANQGYDPGMSVFSNNNPWFNFNASVPFGNTPPPGTPGASQGPTLPQLPTFFDPQGYPFAVPNVAPGSDFNAHLFTHTPQKVQN